MSYHTWDYEDGYHEPSQSQSDPAPAPSLPDLETGGSSPPSSSSGGDGNSFLDLIGPAADWASNYIGPISQGVDWWQRYENWDDGMNAINRGFDRARTDLTEYQQPYVDFGLEHMQGYNDLGEFDFDYQDNYLNSQNYNWLRDQGQQGLERSAAAGGQGLFSGQTLADISKYNQNFAQSQYQQEWDRQRQAHEQNQKYHGFGVTAGAETAQNLGNNLADLGIGHGAAIAGMHGSLAAMQSQQLQNIGQQYGQPGGGAGGGGAGGGGQQSDGSGSQGALANLPSTGNSVLDTILRSGAISGAGDIASIIADKDFLSSLRDQYGTGATGTWFDDLVDLENLTQWDLDQLGELFSTPGVDYGKGSWFEGLDQAKELVEDDTFWSKIEDGISNFAGNIGDALGDALDWATDFFR